VYEGLLRSARFLSGRLNCCALKGNVRVRLGDSRKISSVDAHSVDAVVTSPPYLNAIDYLRGHRLGLVWLGHGVEKIRAVRSDSIGTERQNQGTRDALLINTLLRGSGDVDQLRTSELGMVERYALDVYQFMKQLRRLIKPDGQILLVVGDSCLRGVDVSNARINIAAAELAEMRLVGKTQRPLPLGKRYLPTPNASESLSLSKRMRHETILRFRPR
jgi:DNA modification methylase